MARRYRRKLRRSAAVFVIAAVCIIVAAASLFVMRFRPSGSHEQSSGKSVPSGSSSSSPLSELSSSGTSSVSSSSESSSSGSTVGSANSLLILVNKTHSLPSGFSPSLTEIPLKYYQGSGKDRHFDTRAASYLEQFIDAGRAAGYQLIIYSGYRSYSYQQDNYNRHVNELLGEGRTSSQAQSEAAQLVAPPGTSEHETGLAADIVTSSWTGDLTAAFDQTAAFKWMYAHAADYGFILRYTKDKTAVTGYDYEPWHYRFVGVDTAKKIAASGLCLEEYLEKYPQG